MKKNLLYIGSFLSAALALAKLVGISHLYFVSNEEVESIWITKQLVYSMAFMSLAVYLYKLTNHDSND